MGLVIQFGKGRFMGSGGGPQQRWVSREDITWRLVLLSAAFAFFWSRSLLSDDERSIKVTRRGGKHTFRAMRGRSPDLNLVPCVTADISCRVPPRIDLFYPDHDWVANSIIL